MAEESAKIEELLRELTTLPMGDARAGTRETALIRRISRIIAPEGKLERWAVETGVLAKIFPRSAGTGRSVPELGILLMEWCLDENIHGSDASRLGNAHRMLGDAYCRRSEIGGDATSDVWQAHCQYGKALAFFADAGDREQCATVHHNIGRLHRLSGDAESALDEMRIALAMCSKETGREEWIELHSDIAETLLTGDSPDSPEDAIHHLEAAAAEIDEVEIPELWGRVQARLGMAYRGRVFGERLANVKNAIGYFRVALRTFTNLDDRIQAAHASRDLGRALVDRTRLGDGDFWEEAVELFRNSQLVFTESAEPEKWAELEERIGAALFKRLSGENDEDFEVACAHLGNAVRIYRAFGKVQLADYVDSLLAMNVKLFELKRQIRAVEERSQRNPSDTN